MRNRLGMDTNQLAAAVSRPGIDPRRWLDKAIVVDVAVDPQAGVFASMKSLLFGDTYTAYVGTQYAGNAFGDFVPLEVDETVIVAFPGGTIGNGAIVISRFADQSDLPNQNFYTSNGPPEGKDPSPDRWIWLKPATTINIRTTGGGAVNIQADDAGNINVVVNSGKVFLGGTSGTQPVALADVLKTFLDNIRTWLNGHVHGGVTTGGGSTATPVPGTPIPLPTVPDFKATKVEAL